MEYAYHPFSADDLTLLMLNTNVKHSLASTAYNRRRIECAQGLAWVQEAYPDVQALRDVTVEMLDRQVRHRDATVDMRCRFVVEEIARLHAACADLVNADRQPWVVWCDLNAEGDALTSAIPDAVQIAGADSIDEKESRLADFAHGRTRERKPAGGCPVERLVLDRHALRDGVGAARCSARKWRSAGHWRDRRGRQRVRCIAF
jgi:hypothetical protein